MVINWRKPIIYSLLYLTGSKIPQNLKEIKRVGKFSEKEKKEYQEEKLKKLLLYSSKNVPYYKKVLTEVGVVKNNEVFLENFHKISLLTKEIIRKEKSNLYSKEKRKGVYENTSGGSTGEPVRFLQDRYYDDWNIANKLYFFNDFFGKEIGQADVNLWGSERDIYKNSLSLKERIINSIYNRTFLNAFKVSEEDLFHFVDSINKNKPVSMWVYVESIDSLANFIKEKKLKIHSPKFIISTAGTLYPEIRENVEKVFQCPVYNQYGSREVGVMAIECELQKGLHEFFWMNFIEIIDSDIYVTTLNNLAMPLIRYKIGDIADEINSSVCSCGRENLKFQEIKGREISHFKTKDGKLIHGQYIIHQFYFLDWVKKFQILQKDYNLIICKIVCSKEKKEKDLKNIEKNIKLVMGKGCRVNFEFLKNIKPSKSGKYLYTICKVE